MNRLSGIKTRLNLDPNHAGPMKEKTKTNWEHFSNDLFTLGKEKHVAQEQGLLVCYAGERRERCSATIFTATYKREHRADLSRELYRQDLQ